MALQATPLLLTLAVVELSDVAFAVSIFSPAVVDVFERLVFKNKMQSFQ